MNKILLITQARISSSRLPEKVLKEVHQNKTLLDIHLSRLKRSKLIDYYCVATTTETNSDKIVEIALRNGFLSFKGSIDNVLKRYFDIAQLFQDADTIVRVTSDCPLNEGSIVDELLVQFDSKRFDYISNVDPRTLTDGLDVEIFTKKALEEAYLRSSSAEEFEHVTKYIREKHRVQKDNRVPTGTDLRLTVDYERDLDLIKLLVSRLGDECSHLNYINYLKNNPELKKINSDQ